MQLCSRLDEFGSFIFDKYYRSGCQPLFQCTHTFFNVLRKISVPQYLSLRPVYPSVAFTFSQTIVFCGSQEIYHTLFLVIHRQLQLLVYTFRTVCKEYLSSMSTLIKHSLSNLDSLDLFLLTNLSDWVVNIVIKQTLLKLNHKT